jgi:hypothetical protein
MAPAFGPSLELVAPKTATESGTNVSALAIPTSMSGSPNCQKSVSIVVTPACAHMPIAVTTKAPPRSHRASRDAATRVTNGVAIAIGIARRRSLDELRQDVR